MITVADNTISVNFAPPFDLESYAVFLQSKHLPEYNLAYDYREDSYRLTCPARFAAVFGIDEVQIDRGWLPMPEYMFDYEAFFTQVALDAKRYAIWADTGLGKTAMGLEFGRQVCHRTGGRFLMISPLNIIPQTLDEAVKFYGDAVEISLFSTSNDVEKPEIPAGGLPITLLETRRDLVRWCEHGAAGTMAIVNPEKFIPRRGQRETVSELQHLTGVWLDESSLLKSGGGTIKWSIIKSCRGIEYKLSTTATPAPNDAMEYASQGSFLEKLRSEGEILWTFFVRDKFGNWKVKDHARAAFYRFMAGWSVYLRNPSAYGFVDNLKDLPRPVIREHRIQATPEQRKAVRSIPDPAGQLPMFGTGDSARVAMPDRIRQSQMARGFVYEGAAKRVRRIDSRKPQMVADLVIREATVYRRQVLVWTVFDAESDIIADLLQGRPFTAEVLHGRIPKGRRPSIIERFRKGQTDVLISKASMLGYGLNFQNCGAMVFSGFNDSFEQFYQAVRRAYRYGQTRPVHIHIPYIPELEGVIWNNVLRKQEQFTHDCAIQERNYVDAMKGMMRHAA